jgi:uncharacterized protein YukE
MESMSNVPAPIPFPPNLAPAPLVALASDLKRFGLGLQQGATNVAETAAYAMRTWQGQASAAFSAQAVRKADEMARTAAAVDFAPEVLLRYAESISEAKSVHDEVSAMYDQYVRLLPDSEATVIKLVTAQGDAVNAANTAAQYCSDALRSITQNITNISNGLSWLTPRAPQLFGPNNPMFGGPAYNGPQISASPPRMFETQPEPFDYVHAIHNAKSTYKKGLWASEVFEEWVHLNAHRIEHLIKTQGRNGGKAFLRNGREVLAWKPGAGLTATEGTLAQTTARLAQIESRLAKLKVVIKGANVVGALLSGVVQVADDWDGNYTTTQRTARAATSTALEGFGAVAGFAVGAKVGAAVGVWFGVVGAVPGAIIGGVFGVAGALLFGWAGKKAKEKLFEKGSEELFGGQVERERENAR